MRRTASILTVLLVVLALAACYWAPSGGTGEFTVRLAGGAKGLGDEDAARVWLLTENNVLVPIGEGTDWTQAALSADTQVTVDGIPAGPRYKVLISLGTVEGTGENSWFRVNRWAESLPFEISAGATVPVSVGLAGAPFTYAEAAMGDDLRGLVVSGGSLYTVSEDTLYRGAAAGSMAVAATLQPDDGTANSLSIGVALPGQTDVWVNTTGGILPFTGSGFDRTLTTNLQDQDGEPISILESGGFTDATGTPFTVLFFQREGGLGGADVTSYDPGNPFTALQSDDWIDVDVSDIVSGQPVQDFYVDMTSGQKKAYFITKLGAFGADQHLLDQGADPDLMNSVTFFSVENGSIPILAIEKGSSEFLLGTADGVWTTADPTAATPVFTQIAGTGGYSIYKLAASGTYWAAMSPYYLLIGSGASVVEVIPFSAGLPGKVSSMVWNGGTLVIAGSEGLVEISPTM